MSNRVLAMCTQGHCNGLTDNILDYMRPESQCPQTNFYHKFLLKQILSIDLIFKITGGFPHFTELLSFGKNVKIILVFTFPEHIFYFIFCQKLRYNYQNV